MRFCFVFGRTGLSRCEHGLDWQSVIDAAVKTNEPKFTDRAKAALTELLEEAVEFIISESKSNLSVIPDVFDQLTCTLGQAVGVSTIVRLKGHELKFVDALVQLRGNNLSAFVEACKNFSKTSLAPWVLLAAARGRVLTPEILALAEELERDDMNVHDLQGGLLHEALRMQSQTLCQFLIRKGTDVNMVCHQTPLQVTLSSRNLKLCKFLFENGADVNLKGAHGEYALHAAVGSKSIESVEWLLGLGANVNATRDSDGMTAIHLAVSMRLVEMSQVLLVHKSIDVEARTKSGDSALILSCVAPAHEQLFEMLFDRTECFAECNNAGATCCTLLQAEAKYCTDSARQEILIRMSEKILKKLEPCNVQ